MYIYIFAYTCIYNISFMAWLIGHTNKQYESQQWVLDNSSPPNATYMRRWTGSALVQIMACRPVGAKPLSEPMLPYYQLDTWEQISVKFKSEFDHFHSRKYIWKCSLPGRWVNYHYSVGVVIDLISPANQWFPLMIIMVSSIMLCDKWWNKTVQSIGKIFVHVTVQSHYITSMG